MLNFFGKKKGKRPPTAKELQKQKRKEHNKDEFIKGKKKERDDMVKKKAKETLAGLGIKL
tara:strand:+ start:316 stop:495 length:180 start_codon:yes stop_codon:yes gene_type:complete